MKKKDFIKVMNEVLDEYRSMNHYETCILMLDCYPGSGIFTAYKKFLIECFDDHIARYSLGTVLYGKYQQDLSVKEASDIWFMRVALLSVFFADCLKNKTYKRFSYVQ